VVHGDGATSAWAAGSADRWQLRWLGTDPASATVPRGAPGASLPAMPPLESPLPWPQPAADLARWMAHDLAAAHRVADAAAALGLSLRTLQRQLAAAGTSYRSLLGEVRVRQAAICLARPGTTLAEIGFLCGFADQAHFTREFTRRAGLPPARYRGAAMAR